MCDRGNYESRARKRRRMVQTALEQSLDGESSDLEGLVNSSFSSACLFESLSNDDRQENLEGPIFPAQVYEDGASLSSLEANEEKLNDDINHFLEDSSSSHYDDSDVSLGSNGQSNIIAVQQSTLSSFSAESELLGNTVDSDHDFGKYDRNKSGMNNGESSGKILLRELASWVVSNGIKHRHCDALLKILKNYPGLQDLPSTTRTLLKSPTNVVLERICGGKYYHFGLVQQLKERLTGFPLDSVEMLLNFDGAPLTKSTNSQIWPVTCKIANTTCMYMRPILIGIFWGMKKPSEPNVIFDKIANELDGIKTAGGIKCGRNGKLVTVRKVFFTLDAPARSLVLHVKEHSGYSSCPKCEVVGEYAKNNDSSSGRVVFLDNDARLRTTRSLLHQSDKEYHKGVSTVITRLCDNPVDDVSLCYMHVVLLGVQRKLLNAWINRREFKMSPQKIRSLNNNIMYIRRYCPREFARKPRVTTDLPRYKATEFRQFLLYTGVVLLQNKLPLDKYKHFLLLHVAIKILTTRGIHIELNEYANQLLRTFNENCTILYGKEFVTTNVHHLIHLANDALKHGPLDVFAAWFSENLITQLKRKTNSCQNEIESLVRRVIESEMHATRRTSYESVKFEFKFEHFKGPLLGHLGSHGTQYKQLRFKGMLFSRVSDDEANCCVLLNDAEGKKIVVIENLLDERSTQIVGRFFENVTDLYDYPLPSSRFDIYQVSKLSGRLNVWPVTSIAVKCYRLPRPGRIGSFAVFPLITVEGEHGMDINNSFVNET